METLVLLTIAIMGAISLWWCAAMPVVDWDSWAFHMPHMALWLQSGSFTRMVQEAARPRNSYPYGWEALCTLFLTPFGEDVLVTFPNLVAWAMLGLATYLLARLWRARRIHALACSALLLAIPYVAAPVNTMHVDLPFAALFITAVYFGATWARTGGLVPLGLGAATIGLACATRVTGPAYALLLGLWLSFVRYRSGSRGRTPRHGGLRRWPALVGFVVAIVLGGFWYGKNLVELGHPLGAGAPFDGPESAEGSWSYFAAQTLVFTVKPLQLSSWKVLFDRTAAELRVPFLAIVAMAALWPLAAVWQRRPRRDGSGAEVALLLLGTGALFWVTPLSANSGIQVRLGLPFLAALAVAAAVGATRGRLRAEVAAILAIAGAWGTFASSRVLYPLVLASIVAWGLWPLAAKQRSRATAAVVVCAVFLGFATITLLARERRERERRWVYGPFWEYLEQHVAPTEPVAYLNSHRSYLFYGRRLARSVVYAPFTAGQRVEDWAEPLRQRGISLVATGPGGNSAAFAQLTAAGTPLVVASGSGKSGDINLFRLRAASAAARAADR